MYLIPPEITESEIIPYRTNVPPGEKIIVLAPHPDDETLGCGGSLRFLLKAKKQIKVLFLTMGEKADPSVRNVGKYEAIREKEALRAMKILGISQYEFLRFPDRELSFYGIELKKKLESSIKHFVPDIIYSPSPLELNPDHRTTASIAEEMANFFGMNIIFYELTTPIRPNLLVDISDEYRTKKRAIKSYKSQLKILDYLTLIKSLNRYRTMTLGSRTRYAEAFWFLDKNEKKDMFSWLSYDRLYKSNL